MDVFSCFVCCAEEERGEWAIEQKRKKVLNLILILRGSTLSSSLESLAVCFDRIKGSNSQNNISRVCSFHWLFIGISTKSPEHLLLIEYDSLTLRWYHARVHDIDWGKNNKNRCLNDICVESMKGMNRKTLLTEK